MYVYIEIAKILCGQLFGKLTDVSDKLPTESLCLFVVLVSLGKQIQCVHSANKKIMHTYDVIHVHVHVDKLSTIILL